MYQSRKKIGPPLFRGKERKKVKYGAERAKIYIGEFPIWPGRPTSLRPITFGPKKLRPFALGSKFRLIHEVFMGQT